MTETETEIMTDDGCRLSGTLSLPTGVRQPPAAVILSGSGPLDRDANMDRQPLDVSRAIAERLRDCGIATLRFDKRGVGRSGGVHATTGFERETADARCAVDHLRSTGAVAGVGVGIIGHSVGATIATRIAAADVAIGFAVLLAGSAQKGVDVMAWQSNQISASLPGPDRFLGSWFRHRQRRDREAVLTSTGDTPGLDRAGVPARWLREYMGHDPRPDLAEMRCPVLAITGRKDLQVDAGDLPVIAATVRGRCTTSSPAHLTHVLRQSSHRPSLLRYRKLLQQPVDSDLLDTIATWVAATTASPIQHEGG